MFYSTSQDDQQVQMHHQKSQSITEHPTHDGQKGKYPSNSSSSSSNNTSSNNSHDDKESTPLSKSKDKEASVMGSTRRNTTTASFLRSTLALPSSSSSSTVSPSYSPIWASSPSSVSASASASASDPSTPTTSFLPSLDFTEEVTPNETVPTSRAVFDEKMVLLPSSSADDAAADSHDMDISTYHDRDYDCQFDKTLAADLAAASIVQGLVQVGEKQKDEFDDVLGEDDVDDDDDDDDDCSMQDCYSDEEGDGQDDDDDDDDDGDSNFQAYHHEASQQQEMTTTGGDQKSVRFIPTCKLIYIPKLSEMPDEEYEAVYFTRDDYQRIRDENKRTVQRMTSEDGSVHLPDSDEEYFRGLEFGLSKYALQRRRVRSATLKMVTYIQHQRTKNTSKSPSPQDENENEHEDPDHWTKLQRSYEKHTKKAQMIAIRSASFDANAAANIYFSSTAVPSPL